MPGAVCTSLEAKNNYSPLLDFKNFCQMDGTIDKIHKKLIKSISFLKTTQIFSACKTKLCVSCGTKPEANELLLVGGGLFPARAYLVWREYLKSISIPPAIGYCQYQCLESQ